jgi:hypothetical protein
MVGFSLLSNLAREEGSSGGAVSSLFAFASILFGRTGHTERNFCGKPGSGDFALRFRLCATYLCYFHLQ